MPCLIPSRGRRAAFTLVELLVVIGIIALLISILLPSLNKARSAAKDVMCQSNLRQIGIAMMMYADQNKGIFPYDGDPRFSKDTDGDQAKKSLGWWDDAGLWINVVGTNTGRKSYGQMQLDALANPTGSPLPNYLTGKSVLICPLSTDPGNSTASTDQALNGYYRMWGHAARIPAPAANTAMTAAVVDVNGAAAVQRDVYTSYGINAKLNGTSRPAKQSQLRPSPEIVMVMDRRMNLAELPAVLSSQYGSPGGNDLPSRRLNRIKAKWDYATARHRGGGNYLMADGHVTWFSMADVLMPPNYTTGATTIDFNVSGKIIWDPFGKALP